VTARGGCPGSDRLPARVAPMSGGDCRSLWKDIFASLWMCIYVVLWIDISASRWVRIYLAGLNDYIERAIRCKYSFRRIIESVAGAVDRIGAVVSSGDAAAAGPTRGVASWAAGDVSTGIAVLF
jgi:hypothetical protein